MQVAQAAGAILEVGFELVRAVIVARVARLLLGELAFEEALGVEAGVETGLESLEQRCAAPHEAGLEQVGFDGDVGVGLGDAGVDGAHAVADFKPEVPAGLHPGFQSGLLRGCGLCWQDEHDVDVGAGEQFAAPVTADGCKRAVGRQREPVAEFGEHGVDQRGVTRQIAGGCSGVWKGGGKRPAAGFQPLAQISDRVGAHAARRMLSGTAGLPADTVKTS